MKTLVLMLAILSALPLGCSYNRFDHPGDGADLHPAPGLMYNKKEYITDVRTHPPKDKEAFPAATSAGGLLAVQVNETAKKELTDDGRKTERQGTWFQGGWKLFQYQENDETTWTKGKWERTGNGWRWTGPSLQSRGNLNIKPVTPSTPSQPESP